MSTLVCRLTLYSDAIDGAAAKCCQYQCAIPLKLSDPRGNSTTCRRLCSLCGNEHTTTIVCEAWTLCVRKKRFQVIWALKGKNMNVSKTNDDYGNIGRTATRPHEVARAAASGDGSVVHRKGLRERHAAR